MRKQLLIATLAALFAACPTSTKPDDTETVTGDFTFEVLPSSLSVIQGEEAYLLVNLTPSGGFASAVTLTGSGLPAGVSLAPTTVSAGATTAQVVVQSGPGAAGSATVTVTATAGAGAGAKSHAATFELSVTPAPSGGTNPQPQYLIRLDQTGDAAPTGYSNPTGIAVNPTNGVVYMVSDEGTGLAVYDPVANTLGIVPLPSSASQVAVNSTTGTVYAVGGTSNLYVVNGTNVSQVAVGGALQDVAVDSATNQIFVAEDAGQTVYQVDGASLQVSPTTWRFSSETDGPVRGPLAVDEQRHTVYAALYGGVGVINQANGDSWRVDLQRVASTLTQSPVDLSVDPRNGQVYILGRDGFSGTDGWIHLLDDSYYPADANYTGTNAPTSLAVDPGTNKLYIADSKNHSLNVLDLNTKTFLPEPVVIPPSGGPGQDSGPIGVAVDPGSHQVYATYRFYNGVPAVVVIDGK